MSDIIAQAKALVDGLKTIRHQSYYFNVSQPAIRYNSAGRVTISVSLLPNPNDPLIPSVKNLEAIHRYLQQQFSVAPLRCFTLRSVEYIEIVLQDSTTLNKWQLAVSV